MYLGSLFDCFPMSVPSWMIVCLIFFFYSAIVCLRKCLWFLKLLLPVFSLDVDPTEKKDCATFSAMIVASIFTGAAPLTFTGWRRSHPTVQDWVCLLAAAWSRKAVISAASELQDCIVFPERKAKCCVCRWQTNQNVVSHTQSERTLGTMLFTIFDSQFKLGLKDPFQSELDETDLWLMSSSVSRWSSATKWPTSTGCMKTLARSEPQCAVSPVLPQSCASFVKAPLVQRDGGRSLTAAVVDLVVLWDVTCVGSVRTSAIKKGENTHAQAGVWKTFFHLYNSVWKI